MGRDEYPVSVAGTYDLMNRTSGELEKNKRNTRNSSGGGHGRTGATFAQSRSNNGNNDVCTEAEPIAGNDGRLLPHISCYNCGNKGHYAGQCNEDDRRQNSERRGAGFIQLNAGCTFAQSGDKNAVINKDWLLLDTCSTDSVCCNLDVVESLRKCQENEVLTIVTNGGSLKYTTMGVCKLFPVPMHYNESSIANILSLHQVANLPGFRVTMDSAKEKAISVIYNNQVIKFIQCSEGLYYYDTKSSKNNTLISNNNSVNVYPSSKNNVSFLTTVE